MWRLKYLEAGEGSAVLMGKVCFLSSVHTTIIWEGEAQPWGSNGLGAILADIGYIETQGPADSHKSAD